MPTVTFVRLDTDNPLPVYHSTEAAGADLRSSVDTVIHSDEWQLVPTGFAMQIERGYEVQVRPRSGLAFKNGVTVLNSPGTIDSDYRGPVGVLLVNHGLKSFNIKKGDRIAQMVVSKVYQGNFQEGHTIHESARGAQGFGSTGIS